MRLSFELAGATPSNNQLLRMHWRDRGRMSRALCLEVWALSVNRGWLYPAPDRVRVDITRVGVKLLDHDNLYGGAKLLIDCLTKNGLIADDGAGFIDLTVDQEIGTPPLTRVVLEAK